MTVTPAFRSVFSFSGFFLLLAAVSSVLSKEEVKWARSSPVPVQFTPLPLTARSMQGIPNVQQGPPNPSDLLTSFLSSSSLSSSPFLGGKLRLLTTLLGGLRNSGLESSIAGEVLVRLIKISLREIIVPFKKEFLSPFLAD